MGGTNRELHVRDLSARQRELFYDVMRHQDAPQKQQSRVFTLRLPEYQLALVKALAEKLGETPSEVARTALMSGLDWEYEQIPEDLRPTSDEIVLKLGEGGVS